MKESIFAEINNRGSFRFIEQISSEGSSPLDVFELDPDRYIEQNARLIADEISLWMDIEEEVGRPSIVRNYYIGIRPTHEQIKDKIINTVKNSHDLGKVFLVFDSEKSLIGYSTLKTTQALPRAFAMSRIIRPDQRARGYGRELTGLLKRQAKIHGAERIVSLVNPANLSSKRSNSHHGFELVGHTFHQDIPLQIYSAEL